MSEKKKKVNVCWISGNYYERLSFIKKLKNYLNNNGGFELTIFQGDESFEYCRSQILQSSCFSEQKLFIFKSWPKYKSTAQTFYKHFIEMCEKCPEESIIVCNNLQTDSKKVLSAFKKMGKFCDFDSLVPKSQSAAWFSAECERLGKDISVEDCEIALQAIGEKSGKYSYDIDDMTAFINKLVLFVGNRKKIRTDDLLRVCTDESEFIIWNMFEHLDKKRFCECMGLLGQQENHGNNISSFIEQIMAMMIWRYRLLWNLSESSKKNPSNIKASAGNLHKLEKEGKKPSALSTYKIKKFTNGKPQPAYSDAMINNMLSGRGSKPPLACYSRQQLYLVLLVIDLIKERSREATVSEILALLGLLFKQMCDDNIDIELFEKSISLE